LSSCANTSVQLIATSTGTCFWPSLNILNDTVFITQPGVYCVIGTDSLAACSDTACSPNIVQGTPINATISALSPTTICQGDTCLLQAAGASNFQWLLNGNPIVGATSSTLSAVQNGNYAVIAYFVATCPDTSSTIGVNIQNSLNTAITVLGQNPVCQGDTVHLQATGGANFTWILPNGSTVSGNSSLTALVPGNYQVIGANANNTCQDTSNIIAVAYNPNPILSIVLQSGTNPTCQGQSVVLQSTQVFSSYQWLLNGNPIFGRNTSYLYSKRNG